MEMALYFYVCSLAVLFTLSAAVKIILKMRGRYEQTPRLVQWEEAIMFVYFALGFAGLLLYYHQLPVGPALLWQAYAIGLFCYAAAMHWFPKMHWIERVASRRAYLTTLFAGHFLALPFYFLVARLALLDI
ncbi:hypothetical protein [Teredinibacter turnerae]|uniref:hypothetical protein n=1 Tax=Teredinibacter turnerae TaxID=2426 RepID=UPI000381F9E9|nr:hypothetical protein [Teredinibacter turnerae]